MKRPLKQLYENPFPSTRTGALYNAFSYPTKISPEAIALFIASHTEPGDTVLDTFGGSGTTGVAALLCDVPTASMIETAKAIGLSPKWGARKAHIYEISSLGCLIARTLCSNLDPDEFTQAAHELKARAEQEIGWMYAAKDENGEQGRLRHVIWSDVLLCPGCLGETAYWDASVRRAPLRLVDKFKCKFCSAVVNVDECKRVIEKVTDDFGGKVERKKRIPVRIYGATGKQKWSREPNEDDLALIRKISRGRLPLNAPNTDIVWGELYRSGYHKGISKLHHFYTRRNFITISVLWSLIDEFDEKLRDALRLLVLSYNASHSTLMTRVVVKKGQSDFVLTGAQSGVLYVSGMPVEKNILEGIHRKTKSISEALRTVFGSASKVTVHQKSSEKLSLKRESVDYVFTDPPFGGYIPYAEINQLNELWIGEVTDRKNEIIISQSQGKDVSKYSEMMFRVFSEMARVLKPNALATVVFHSAHSDVWKALTSAYIGAGFAVKAASVLDKIQASFKQVVSEISVKGDPLLLLARSERHKHEGETSDGIAKAILKEVDRGEFGAGQMQLLYSKFVGKCLESGIEVDTSAKDFYALARKKRSEAQ